MHCNHCRNRMYQTGEVVERRTRQTWYRCPVCDREHTTSELNRPLPADAPQLRYAPSSD